MPNRIFVTYCSAKKNMLLKDGHRKVTPDELYTSKRIQSFMNACKEKGVNWAIFSDKYGIWLKDVRKIWYEKDPNTVTDKEFDKLVTDFNKKLTGFDEIYFYYNPARFHKLYRKLLNKTELRVTKFTHLREIS